MGPAKLQAALLGGVTIGVLTVLPVVNLVNFCCCAWVVAGGGLAAYLMQQNHPAPITAADGATAGLLAGVFGAVIGSMLAIPIAMATGPFQADMIGRMLETSRDMPPEVRGMLEQLRSGMGTGAAIGLGFLFSLVVSLFVYSIFGLVGGVLGAMLFRKEGPPPPPPPFDPASDMPPPPPPPLPPPPAPPPA